MVAFLRHGYTAPCEFWTDSSQRVTIHWYKAPPNAPVLGYPSAIRPLRSVYFPWVETTVGEVYGEPQKWVREPIVPEQTYKHVCGTREDFETGGRRGDPLNPVLYDRWGLPQCCTPVFVGQGGGAGTGTATVTVTHPVHYHASYSSLQIGPTNIATVNATVTDQVWDGVALFGGWPVRMTSPLYLGQGYWSVVWNFGGSTDVAEYRKTTWDGNTVTIFGLYSGSGWGGSIQMTPL